MRGRDTLVFMNVFSDMVKRLVAFGGAHRIVIVAVVLVCVGAASFSVLRTNTQDDNTLVVHPKEFLQQVSVSGTVIAAQDVELGFTASGRVARSYARVGDVVRAGAVLAEIDNGDLRAAVAQREATLASQQAKLDSLKAGTRPEEIALARAAVESAAAALSQANQSVVNAIRDSYTASDNAVHVTVDQFIQNPRGITPSLTFYTSASQLAINIPTERTMMEDVLMRWSARNATLVATGDVLSAAQEAQHDLTLTTVLLADSAGALNQAQPSQSATVSDIASYASGVATARANINTVTAALTGSVTAQRSAAAALEQAQRTLTLKEAGPTGDDIAAQVALVAAARADIENARAQLSKTLIVAPFSGTVTRMDAKQGEIVSPNTAEISLMSVDRLRVESYVPEISVALVRQGNEALVTLDAYGSGVTFSAAVASVDPAETIRNGVPMYRAVLEFSTQDARIKSGMTANVAITTARREGIISVPQRVVSMRDGKSYVPVRIGTSVEDREVTTGAVSAIGEIEILSGLRDGDTVVLAPAS